MPDSQGPSCPSPPRCPRCGIALVRAGIPQSALGLPGDSCVDCNDAAGAQPTPWSCPRCGGVWVFDASEAE